jgi:hypothetical protein
MGVTNMAKKATVRMYQLTGGETVPDGLDAIAVEQAESAAKYRRDNGLDKVSPVLDRGPDEGEGWVMTTGLGLSNVTTIAAWPPNRHRLHREVYAAIPARLACGLVERLGLLADELFMADEPMVVLGMTRIATAVKGGLVGITYLPLERYRLDDIAKLTRELRDQQLREAKADGADLRGIYRELEQIKKARAQ